VSAASRQAVLASILADCHSQSPGERERERDRDRDRDREKSPTSGVCNLVVAALVGLATIGVQLGRKILTFESLIRRSLSVFPAHIVGRVETLLHLIRADELDLYSLSAEEYAIREFGTVLGELERGASSSSSSSSSGKPAGGGGGGGGGTAVFDLSTSIHDAAGPGGQSGAGGIGAFDTTGGGGGAFSFSSSYNRNGPFSQTFGALHSSGQSARYIA
jgi:hypothetical protein